MKTVARFFSQEDLNHIQTAVQTAEGKTSGEIVPYVVDRSDAYEDADWRGAALLGVVVFSALTVLRQYTHLWLPLDVTGIGLATLAAFAIGFLAVKFVRPLKLLFAGKHLIDHRVAERAAQAFVSEEVFHTRDRTGILIFVSLLEHRVLVVGDSGINAKVRQDDWHGVVQRVVKGIANGKPAEGLVDAILQCGNLLALHGVARKSDDRDELPDTLRLSDR